MMPSTLNASEVQCTGPKQGVAGPLGTTDPDHVDTLGAN